MQALLPGTLIGVLWLDIHYSCSTAMEMPLRQLGLFQLGQVSQTHLACSRPAN